MASQDYKARDMTMEDVTTASNLETMEDVTTASNLEPMFSIIEGKGEEVDDAVLHAQGHEAAMDRQFNWISALGLAFSVTNSWVGYLSCFGQNLVYGGPQSCLFGLIVAFFVQGAITTGLAELGSAFPSSGGQYHFCYILAPHGKKNFAAFVVGWMSVLAWWIVTCSGLSLAAVTMVGLVNYWHPNFVATQWQVYLIYVAVTVITIMPLLLMPSRIAWTTQATLYLSVTGCFVFLIVIGALHGDTQPTSFVVSSSFGISGWSFGVAWVLGITNSMYAFGATDGVIHISEEMPQPGKRVPQVMVMTMIIGLVSTLPLVVLLMVYMTDLDAVTSSALPSLEIVSQAIRNKNVTTFLFTWLWLVYMGSLPSQWVTCGRIAWAFARDHGVPYSEYFSAIHPTLGFPLRTTVAAFCFACVYGLLYLASTTAFNSIVTSAVLFLNITYAVPQGILLLRKRDEALPPRYFNLGWMGYACNIFSVLWIFVLIVFICMPPRLPVEVGSMNYTSVVLVGLVSIVFALWFGLGKRNFRGPNIDWDLLERANRTVVRKASVGSIRKASHASIRRESQASM